MSSAAPRRGRRPGAPDARAVMLAAARTSFAASGYAGTSVRSLAAAALDDRGQRGPWVDREL